MKSYNSTHNIKINKKVICIIFVILIAVLIYYFLSFNIVIDMENKERNNIITNPYGSMPAPVQPPDYDTGQIFASRDNVESTIPRKVAEKDNTSQENDCIISIPAINLDKNVYTGLNRLKYLEQYELVTATDNMTYANGGNYIICGHASRLYGHSLNRIKEIKKDDIIYIQAADKRDKYIVYEVYYENMNHTSKYCVQTEERMLTIISCAKYISKESYIIIHAKLE